MTTPVEPVSAPPGTAIDALRTRLRGPVLLPTDPGYDETRAVWNAMIDRRPALIVRGLGVADVPVAVAFAREHGLPLSIRGGGHNIAGLAVVDGGLMLDLSLMRGVWVDRERRIAHAQPGCLLGDVDRETQLHGLAAVLGFVSNTGIAGLTLGGGFGYLSRRFGWTTDNLLGMDVVTAEGKLVRASERENEDLFWGLRGGGGNFGVVTGFDFQLHPIGPEIVGGAIAWRAEEAPQVLERFREMMEDGPAELSVAAALRPAPPAPWLAPEVHGKPIVLIVVCHTGSLAEGERAIASLKALGRPVGDLLQRRSYVSQQALLDATQPKGRRYYWKSEYLPGLPPELLSGVIDHAARAASPHSAIVLFPVGGVLDRRPAADSAVGNRDAKCVLNVTAQWERAQDDAANIAWARTAWGELKRFSTGGNYVNFQTEDEPGDRVRSAYGANFDRLVTIKRRWDPENVFRANKNIAP